MLQSSITELDNRAIQVTEQRPDQNLYEFDLTLWSLLSTLTKAAPEKVQHQFNLTTEAVRALSCAKEHDLKQLASGVLISFRLQTSEVEITEHLGKEYDQTIQLQRSVGSEFDSAYWLLLKRMAQRDHLVASTAFGVSPRLAVAVSEATDNQLRHLATSIVTAFTLRFESQLLPLLIENRETPMRARLFFRKYQQSMSARQRSITRGLTMRGVER
ncbi:transcriptional regulator [Marinobacterium aestuariivivens]|uniref:Transcriptional regulator n=1 Tax=Marinobacterium aestuariivivens TaxID=1698799 RepID=A0ABW2A973_9GAMM